MTPNAPTAFIFRNEELPAGTGKFNPFAAALKASFEDDLAKSCDVPAADAADAVKLLRKAASNSGVGVTIRHGGSDLPDHVKLHFLGRPVRERN